MARGPREGDSYSAGEPSKAPALPAPYPSWKPAAGHRRVASQACGRQSESPRRPRSHPVSRAPAGRQPPPLLTQASAVRGLSSRIPPRSPAGSCPAPRLSQGGRGPSTLRPPSQDPLRRICSADAERDRTPFSRLLHCPGLHFPASPGRLARTPCPRMPREGSSAPPSPPGPGARLEV